MIYMYILYEFYLNTEAHHYALTYSDHFCFFRTDLVLVDIRIFCGVAV